MSSNSASELTTNWLSVQSPILDSVPYPGGTFLTEGTCLAESTASALGLITSTCHLSQGPFVLWTLTLFIGSTVSPHQLLPSAAGTSLFPATSTSGAGYTACWSSSFTRPTAGPITQTHYPHTHKTGASSHKLHQPLVASRAPDSLFLKVPTGLGGGSGEVTQGDQLDGLEQTQEGALPGDGQQGRRRGRMGGVHTGGDWPFE